MKKVEFIFVAVKPSNNRHNNSARYDKEAKLLELKLGLNYPHIKESEPNAALQMMASLFLVSTDLYAGLNIPDFTTPTFKKDLTDLFETKGWLKAVHNR